jgi:hypothetical protein
VALVRVIVALEPHMYREVLAFHIRKQRPQSEVVLASPQTLQAEAESMKPHLIIANEVPALLRERGFWVEVHVVQGLVATISANGGHSTTIHDISLEQLVAVVDKAEEELAHAQ